MFVKKIKEKILGVSKTENIIESSVRIGQDCFISGSEIHKQVVLGNHCKVFRAILDGNINVGNHTSLWGPNIYIGSHIYSVTIGSFCSIARNVSIQEAYHRHDTISTYHVLSNLFQDKVSEELVSKGKITVGNDVWIGANAVILSGVNVGNGSIVAAGAVVNKDVPSYAIVAGNPAKIVKYRFDNDIIEALSKLNWWEWPIEKIKANKALFQGILTLDKINAVNR